MNNLDIPKVYLASKSPRRHALLKACDIPFEYLNIDVEEDYPEDMPAQEVPTYLAVKKATAGLELIDEGIILTADSIVILDGEILNKPDSREQAMDYLRRLSSGTHEVVTGFCLASHDKMVTNHCLTIVTLAPLSEEEVQYYFETYQPMDKAGAYGIQEWLGHCKITNLEGSFNNVMGLPTHQVYEALRTF